MAKELIAGIEADPAAPMHVCVEAAGGYGKSTILAELRDVYERAGVEVATRWEPSADETVLLVDDAHQLAEPQLRELRALAEKQTRLAVAYRPWPRSAALAELTEVLRRGRQPLMPGPLDRAQVRGVLAASSGAEPSAALVEFVHTQTGGVPGFVERFADGLDSLVGPNFEVPQSVVTRFRYDLDRLDTDVQRFLLACEAGAGLRMDLLTALLDRDSEAVAEIVEAARASGLVSPDGTLLPISRRAIATLIPAQRRIGVRQRLAELQLERGGSVLGLVRSLIGTGVGGPAAAAAFQAAAEEALSEEPAVASSLFAAAVEAGRPMASLAAPWALAAAMSGDLNSALRLADKAITATDPVDRAEGARVAAAALAHRGQLGRSAELLRWSGTDSSVSFAAIGLIGTGQLTSAERLMETPAADGPPTMLAGAASLMAQGIQESVVGSSTTALATLVRAAGLLEPRGPSVLLPDSPAALAALVALHSDQLNIAGPVLQRAVAANLGGTLFSARHGLLEAWICMVRGRTTAARQYLTNAEQRPGPLEPRDWLFAVALEVGLARRGNDVAALRRIWSHACEAVMRHPVDLFTLLPLGEFVTAAARLRDQSRLAPHLLEARSLLERLGNPTLWSTPLHWSSLHAAIIAEQQDAVREHADALAANSAHSRYCAALAAAAGCWVDVIANKVDPVRAEAAARGLHGVGLVWDGVRLAGQAAIRTSDRKAMVSLLDCARVLQGKPKKGTAADPHPDIQVEADPVAPDPSGLSEREREVADLVVAGMTYKQIGDRLFISAKTVEYHMARIRQRLGATTRSELLAQLRALTPQPK